MLELVETSPLARRSSLITAVKCPSALGGHNGVLSGAPCCFRPPHRAGRSADIGLCCDSLSIFWCRFVVFTGTIFPFAIAYFSPRHGSAVFWIVMAGLFVVHIIFFVPLIRYVRQLTGFDYILYGPLEALAFAVVIPRAMRMVRGRAGGPDAK